MVIGFAAPMATTESYWILQRRLLPHAEHCLWWVGQVCDGKWGADEALVNAIHMLGILYADQGRLGETEAMYQRPLRGKEKALDRIIR